MGRPLDQGCRGAACPPAGDGIAAKQLGRGAMAAEALVSAARVATQAGALEGLLQLDSLRRALGEVPQDLGEPRAGWVVAVAAARPTAWLVSEGAPSP